MPVAISLILLAVLCRVLPTMDLTLSNLSPFTAIAFCGAVYFRRPWFWAVSFFALELSDLYVNYFHAREYGFTWSASGFILRSACFGAALYIGTRVAKKKSWLSQHPILGRRYFLRKNSRWLVAGADDRTPGVSAHDILLPQHPFRRPDVYWVVQRYFGMGRSSKV